MKVVLSCDDLIQRDHLTEVFEAFIEIFEDAEIYTLVHKQGAILGPIEMRPIHASGMTHRIQERDDFGKWSFLVPTAANTLFIPCSVDLIVNLSNGLSHGIKKCEKTKQITYLYDFFLEGRPAKTWRERFFKSYTKSWSMQKLKQADQIWVSSEALKDKISAVRDDAQVLNPFFNISDFPIIPSSTFKYDYYAINAVGLDPEKGRQLMELLKRLETRFCFVGQDEHLNKLKEGTGDSLFFGERCSGELAPLLSGARGVIDFNNAAFPKLSLSALATGRPIIVSEARRNPDYLQGEGIISVNPGTIHEVESAISKLDEEHHTFEPKRLRGIATKFHDVKFKAAVRRRVDQLFA